MGRENQMLILCKNSKASLVAELPLMACPCISKHFNLLGFTCKTGVNEIHYVLLSRVNYTVTEIRDLNLDYQTEDLNYIFEQTMGLLRT